CNYGCSMRITHLYQADHTSARSDVRPESSNKTCSRLLGLRRRKRHVFLLARQGKVQLRFQKFRVANFVRYSVERLSPLHRKTSIRISGQYLYMRRDSPAVDPRSFAPANLGSFAKMQ